MVMVVLIGLLIITNVFDEIAVRYWSFNWNWRKVIETLIVVISAAVICPILYKKYFIYDDKDEGEKE